jgi:uncharacterized membrane protein YvbJ
MFSKKNRVNPNMYTPPYSPYMNNGYMNNGLYNNNYDVSFLETEINELKRNTLEISKRLTRIENYLNIRNEESNNSSLF